MVGPCVPREIKGTRPWSGHQNLSARAKWCCSSRPRRSVDKKCLTRTSVVRDRMTRLFRITALMCCVFACFLSSASATTYYVSSSGGSDSNAGTSSGTAWQTMGKVNAQAFLPGDTILLRRGDVWNESLAPGTSGAAGNPITFDAYGVGAPPNLTGYYAVPSTAWVLVTGNAWKAAVPATVSAVNFCLFGSVWGQKVAASTSNLTAQWNFYLANGFIYVFSVGTPANYYSGPIVPMALSNTPVININGKSWLTFQHLLVNWFDQYGVYVQGASDHLVFANMEVDSMIPQGTQPLGFYVNETAPGDIKIYNSEAHMNYDGFRFDGAATAITMVNDKAYGNRDGALVESGGRVCFYYPRLSPNPGMGSSGVNWSSGAGVVQGTSKGSGGVQKGLTNSAGKSMREEFSAIVPPLSAISLRASFLALPYIDANDGQSVLCFRSYFPGGMAAAY